MAIAFERTAFQPSAFEAAAGIQLVGALFTATGTDVDLSRTSAYSLGLSAGSVSVTGQVVDFTDPGNRLISLANAVFSVSVSGAGFSNGRRVAPAPNAFVVIGRDATLGIGAGLPTGHGAYSVSGKDVSWRRTYAAPLATGAFSTAGAAAGVVRAAKVLTGNKAFDVSGQSIQTRFGSTLLLSAGAFTATGSAVTLLATFASSLSSVAYAVSGQSVSLRRASNVSLTGASYAATERDIKFRLGGSLPLAAATIVSAGYDISFRRTYAINAALGSCLVSGQSVAVLRTARVVFDGQQFTSTGKDAAFRFAAKLYVQTGAYVRSQPSIDLRRDARFTADVGSGAFFGKDAAVQVRRKVAVETTTISIAPGITVFRTEDPLVRGGYNLIGDQIALRRTATLTVDGASTTNVTGRIIGIRRGYTARNFAGAYAFSGRPVAWSNTHLIQLAASQYAATGKLVQLRAFLSDFAIATYSETIGVPTEIRTFSVDPEEDALLSVVAEGSALIINVELREMQVMGRSAA